MTILDKLLEKKDLLAYIDFRIERLQENIKEAPQVEDEQNIHSVVQRLETRISELKRLKSAVSEGKLKDEAKKHYKPDSPESGRDE